MSITVWALVNRVVDALRVHKRWSRERALSVVMGTLVRATHDRRLVPTNVDAFEVLEHLEAAGLVMRKGGAFVPTGRAVQIVRAVEPTARERFVTEAGFARGTTRGGKKGAKKSAKSARVPRECGCVCKCGKNLTIARKSR